MGDRYPWYPLEGLYGCHLDAPIVASEINPDTGHTKIQASQDQLKCTVILRKRRVEVMDGIESELFYEEAVELPPEVLREMFRSNGNKMLAKQPYWSDDEYALELQKWINRAAHWLMSASHPKRSHLGNELHSKMSNYINTRSSEIFD